ncbi:MAG: hypothetical protein R3C26_09265 [Calditrichia bacterium]
MCPPGVYEVRANYIGYRDVVVTSVSVSVDKTTTVNFELNESVVESDAVEVVAEKPLIKKDLTSTNRSSQVRKSRIYRLPASTMWSIYKPALWKALSRRSNARRGGLSRQRCFRERCLFRIVCNRGGK